MIMGWCLSSIFKGKKTDHKTLYIYIWQNHNDVKLNYPIFKIIQSKSVRGYWWKSHQWFNLGSGFFKWCFLFYTFLHFFSFYISKYYCPFWKLCDPIKGKALFSWVDCKDGSNSDYFPGIKLPLELVASRPIATAPSNYSFKPGLLSLGPRHIWGCISLGCGRLSSSLLDAHCWVLVVGCLLLNAHSWGFILGYSLLESRWMVVAGCSLLCTCCWVLILGYSLLGAPCWNLIVGYSLLDAHC